jgi:hypothetical protein
MLTSLGNIMGDGVKVTVMQGEKHDALPILCQEDVWMHDMGASNQVMLCNKGAVNVHVMLLLILSLGHTGEAIEPTAIIDISGQFISKSGETGMKAVLTDCSYNKAHNFNLLSMLRLLHNQGRKITCGDALLIHFENGKDGVIEFDIVLPASKGEVYACKFVQSTEVIAVSTETGKEINVNITHCLLGHRNEDMVQKTARELGWMITRGTIYVCKH